MSSTSAIPELRGSMTLPRIKIFEAQPVLTVAENLTMAEIGTRGPLLLNEVTNGMTERGLAPCGPPFFRFDVINMEAIMQMSFGVPVAAAHEGFGRVRPGIIPPGRYMTVLHQGHPDEIYDCFAMIMGWAKARNVTWDSEMTDAGERFAARIEIYKSDPDVVPMDQWETELRIKLPD